MVTLSRPDHDHLDSRQRAVFLIIGVLFLGWATSCVIGFYAPKNVQPDWYPAVSFQKGMSYTTWHMFSYNSSQAREDFQEMRAAGVEWVAINDQWYQSNLTSQDIHPSPAGDSIENLSDAFSYARSIGLHIFYKPMLQIESGEWQNWIVYTPAWMAAYTTWIVSRATFAAQSGVELFSIGCEMGSMQGHSDAVRAMIAEVRAVYHGLITYAANYDGFWNIDWYDAIDVIGADMYPPMLFTYSPPLEDLIQFWNGLYNRLQALSSKWNRPILFTEIGAQALEGANMSPSQDKFCDQQDVGGLINMYKSVFQSKLWTAPWFKGVYWWVWDNYEPDPAHPERDTQFSPEIPAVLATITAEYNSSREPVPSSFLAMALVPIATGGAMLVLLAWRLDRGTEERLIARKRERVTRASLQAFTPLSRESERLMLDRSGLGVALLQGSLLGTLIYLGYANFLLPLFFTGYYNPPLLPLYMSLSCVAMLIAGACLHVSARRSARLLLIVLFLYACWYPGTVSGLSYDGSWLKVLLDALMMGLVLATLVRITATNSMPNHAFLKARLGMTLVTLGGFLACATIFDQLAVGFTVVPAGLGLLAFRVSKNENAGNGPSNSDANSSKETGVTPEVPALYPPRNAATVASTLIVALVAGILIPLGATDYNLLYIDLLPLVLSLLPPVVAGVVIFVISLGIHTWFIKKHGTSNHTLQWCMHRVMAIFSSRGILIYALVFEGLGIVLLVAGAPSIIWALLAGMLLVNLVGAVFIQITGQMWKGKNGRLFVYLLLIVAFIITGTIINAIKGSQVYAYSSPVSYNVAIAINAIITTACVPVTIGGLMIELLVKRKINREHHTP
ncbi:MAG TPA: hypothetical protein VKM55_07720 [Candidatus Lokiarchaeia archaeon]|nr:hypothetical protein [Candidatus Lokiarchaeia archaeon]